MSTKSPSSSPRKRQVREFENLSSINDPENAGEKALVHGVVSSLSPKKGKFFDDSLNDKTGKIRFVAFNDRQRTKIEQFVKQKEAVKFTNCTVQKEYSGGDGMEIVLNDHTTITKSEKNFEIEFPSPEAMSNFTDTVKNVTLSQLNQQAAFQKVAVKVKIVEVAETVLLDNNCQVQDVTVADESGTAKLTLWQANVGKLTVGKTYSLHNVMVKCYCEEFCLTTPKAGMTITEIENLPKVVEVVPQNNSIKEFTNAKVVAVRNLQRIRSCRVYKKGEMNTMEQNVSVGTCTKCPTTALLSVCEFHASAQLVVMCDNIQYQLRALGLHMCQIAQKKVQEPLTEIDLVLSGNFDCKYNHDTMNIINVYPKHQE